MDRCYKCGGEIEFRRQGGSIVPIHLNGSCTENPYSSAANSEWGGFRSLSPYSSSLTYSNYVNPNARCPICHEQVFFYQSSDGGRVFFDELGPPWPKHPCTNSSANFAGIVVMSNEPMLDKQYEWQKKVGCRFSGLKLRKMKVA